MNVKNKLKSGLAKAKTFLWYIHARDRISNETFRKILTIVALPIGIIAANFKNNKKKYNLKYNLSIVLIAKNEGNYIQEWIEYYKILGFDKFYIFDNDSTDNTKQKIEKYIKSGLVDYNAIHGKARQMDAYNLALNKSKKESKYLAIVDADEFIYLPFLDKQNIQEILDKLFDTDKSVGGIGINWLIFGSSHFIKRPHGLVTQNYLYRSYYDFPVNKHVKTICDPRKVEGILNPHYVEYKKGYYAINTLGKYMEGPMTENDPKMPLRINHYFTKSKEEFLAKRARGMADQEKLRSISDFDLHDKNDVYDDGMLRYGKKLKDLLERD